MTLSSTTVKQIFTGTGSQTDFAIPFSYFDESEVVVILRNEAVDPVTETTQVVGAGNDYTLTGDSQGLPTTVSMNVAPASTSKLLIKRVRAITQTTDYLDTGTFLAEDHEETLDKVIAITQQLNEKLSRAAQLPETTALTSLILPEPDAGKYLAWNTGETALENVLAVSNSLPVIAKGDIFAYTGSALARLAAGSNNQILTPDSTTTTGLKWKSYTASQNMVTDASGNPTTASLTASKIMASDSSGLPTTTSVATLTELGYLSGVTSAIQTQIAAVPGSRGTFLVDNLGLAASYGSSALTINLKQNDGSSAPTSGNPVKIAMNSVSNLVGAVNIRSVTAALSIVVPSTATLGHTSTLYHPVYIYAIDNAGTIELAVSYNGHWDIGDIVSTTILNASSTARNVMYSTTARSNVPCRLIGVLITKNATAGTWVGDATDRLRVMPTPNTYAQAMYFHSLGSSIASSTTPAIVNYDTKIYDSHNAVTTGSSWVWTAPFNCALDVHAMVGFEAATDWAETEVIHMEILMDSTIIGVVNKNGLNTGVSSVNMVNMSRSYYVPKASTIQVKQYQNSAVSIALITSLIMPITIKAHRIYETIS